jgi:hypothetical protein
MNVGEVHLYTPDGAELAMVLDLAGRISRTASEQLEWAISVLDANMIATMGDMLSGSAKTREAVFRQWGQTVADPVALSEEQAIMWAKVPADLAGKAAHFRALARDIGSRVKELRAQLNDLRQCDSSGVENLPALRDKLNRSDQAKFLTNKRDDIQRNLVRFNQTQFDTQCPQCGKHFKFQDPGAKKRAEEAREEIEKLDADIADMGDTTNNIDALRAQVMELSKLEGARERADDLSTQVAAKELEATDARVLSGEASRLLVESLKATKANAEASVNEYLRDQFEASLHLTDKECTWMMHDNMDGMHHPSVAGGAERAALVTALICATCEINSGRVALLDDVDLVGANGEALTAILDAIGAAVDDSRLRQALVVVDSDRTHRIPDDWNVHEVK